MIHLDIRAGAVIGFILFGGLFKLLVEIIKFILVLMLTFYLALGIFDVGNEIGRRIMPQLNRSVPPMALPASVYPHVIEIPSDKAKSQAISFKSAADNEEEMWNKVRKENEEQDTKG